MDLKTIGQTITQIAEDKGIARDRLVEAIELALASAFKRETGRRAQHIKAEFNPRSGEVKLWQMKLVVTDDMLRKEGEDAETEAEPEEGDKKIRFHPERHIQLDEALIIKPGVRPGEELPLPIEAKLEFGRIAAQTAKQVILQRLREIERDALLGEFKKHEGEVLSGVVERVEEHRVFINLGRTTGLLPSEEGIPGERLRVGERVKVFVYQVSEDPKGPLVLLSRAHPKLVSKLFALEVPEMQQDVVEVKMIAREAGSRSKIAVASHDTAVDPVGACVGQKGTRVGAVMSELAGEKIDIIPWSEDPVGFVRNAMSPSRVARVVRVDEKRREIQLEVPTSELSLAIGRGGQNVRLAAKLTGWKIEVVGDETKVSPDEEKAPASQESTPKLEAETATGEGGTI